MRAAPRLAALVALGITTAVTPGRAEATEDGVYPLDVQVGHTVVVDVAHARGLQCDDVVIIDPDLRPHDASSNWFYVTGRSPGTTLCRTGIFGETPSYVFRVTVRR